MILRHRVLLGVGLLTFASIVIGVIETDAGRNEQLQMATVDWTGVTGSISSNSFEIKRAQNDGVTYIPRFAYAYEVNGAMQSSSRIDFLTTAVSRSRADALKEQFPIGREVVVYHDPQTPTEAVLVRGWTEAHDRKRTVRRTLELITGLGVLIMVVGVVLGRARISPG